MTHTHHTWLVHARGSLFPRTNTCIIRPAPATVPVCLSICMRVSVSSFCWYRCTDLEWDPVHSARIVFQYTDLSYIYGTTFLLQSAGMQSVTILFTISSLYLFLPSFFSQNFFSGRIGLFRRFGGKQQHTSSSGTLPSTGHSGRNSQDTHR